MLIAVRLRFPRPAALPRRRSFAVGALLGALATVVALASWHVQSIDAAAQTELTATRRAAHRAVESLRDGSTSAARLVEQLITDAETATAQEATAPVWRRSPGRVQAAWNRVVVHARRALVDQRRRQQGFLARWLAMRDEVGADVRRALVESEESGLGRGEIAAAQQARLRWELAERYADGGEPERAIASAEQASAHAAIVHRGFVELHSRFLDPRNLAAWRAMARETIELSRRNGSTVIVVDKLQRKLYLYTGGRRTGSFEAELGAKGLRQKLHAGDQATPEGRYRVTKLRGLGQTTYYKALLIDYPNETDRARYTLGRRTGQVPSRVGIGSLIEIHGDGGQGRDWTDGCVALSNSDMDEVFARARVGTPVAIVGTL